MQHREPAALEQIRRVLAIPYKKTVTQLVAHLDKTELQALLDAPDLCADIDGFSLHAAVRVQAHNRRRLEQPCRFITRPALSDERVQLNAAGQVQLELETPWRDGTTHLVMSPLEFMQRLAARATNGCPSGSRAAATVAPHTLSRRAGPERHAARKGWCRQARRLRPKPGAR